MDDAKPGDWVFQFLIPATRTVLLLSVVYLQVSETYGAQVQLWLGPAWFQPSMKLLHLSAKAGQSVPSLQALKSTVILATSFEELWCSCVASDLLIVSQTLLISVLDTRFSLVPQFPTTPLYLVTTPNPCKKCFHRLPLSLHLSPPCPQD